MQKKAEHTANAADKQYQLQNNYHRILTQNDRYAVYVEEPCVEKHRVEKRDPEDMTPISPYELRVTAIYPSQISAEYCRYEYQFCRDDQHHGNLPMVLALLKHDS